MNKLIKKFRFEAAEYANEQKPVGLMKWNEIRDAKFAELVIAECLGVANTIELEYLANRREASDFSVKSRYAEGEAACSLVREKIAEHFGLE